MVFRFAIGNPVAASPARDKISIICKPWRQVLYQTSSLWSTIDIRYRFDPVEQMVAVPDTSALRACLRYARARGRCLDVTIERRVEDNDPEDILRTLCLLFVNLSRWRTFSFIGDPSLLDEYRWKSVARSTGLETSTIVAVGAAHNPPVYNQHFPSLRHLDLELNLPLLKMFGETQWSSLHSLSASFDSVSQGLKILRAATPLSSLTVWHVEEDAAAAPSSQQPILHPHLKHLHMHECGVRQFSQYLQVPNLSSSA